MIKGNNNFRNIDVELISVLHHMIYSNKEILSLIGREFINTEKTLNSRSNQLPYATRNIIVRQKSFVPN
jgi:hypothetical protein